MEAISSDTLQKDLPKNIFILGGGFTYFLFSPQKLG